MYNVYNPYLIASHIPPKFTCSLYHRRLSILLYRPGDPFTMRFSSIITLGLLTTSVSAVRGRRFRRQKKPENPTDPGITPKCTFYDTWVDDDLDCLLWLEDWSITPEQFSEYVSLHSIYQLSLWFP